MRIISFSYNVADEDAAPPRTPPRVPLAVRLDVEATTLADDELRTLLSDALDPSRAEP